MFAFGGGRGTVVLLTNGGLWGAARGLRKFFSWERRGVCRGRGGEKCSDTKQERENTGDISGTGRPP